MTTPLDTTEQNDDEASGSAELPKLELWRIIPDPSKVIEAFYLEGNYYHNEKNLQELSILAKTAPKNVRDTLSRLRKKDEKAGNYVPPPPRHKNDYSEEQRNILLDAFEKSNSIDADGAKELAETTGLTPRQVSNWFCHQRRKLDGRLAERCKERRARIKQEKIKNGTLRTSIFCPEALELLESEFQKTQKSDDGEGNSVVVPYDMLVEKLGMERKQIRDWFSKRKLRGKPKNGLT
ncbi:hypothetical protein CAEBREN_25210 [Caenorhabditis brenneri]|uniref:Homeobox domain-containing protein n=1 Tax=Caenorhabditis brenneri TaxID=135651 RepID=G0PI65_CAEBE|nr:hypothetical protein CAEBREN_25210 [Caenorhabditis brenneri]